MSKQPLIEQLDAAIAEILANPGVTPAVADASVKELLLLAQDLGGLPSPDFKARLKTDLERKVSMSAKTAVFRKGFRTVTSYLLPPGPEFVEFLKNAFGAEETERTQTGPGRFHAEFRIGDSMLMIGVGSGMTMPAAVELYVPNVDEVFKRAVDAGCKVLDPVENAHWEPLRLGTLEDPVGNVWVIATRLEGNYLPEGRNSLTTSLFAKGAAGLVDFTKRAFDATELRRFEWPGGLYVSLRIGDSVVGVSEPSNHEWMRPMPSMIYMYVPDCDALYQQALAAGATSVSAPTDQSYGDRSGGVKDAWGNIWYLASPR